MCKSETNRNTCKGIDLQRKDKLQFMYITENIDVISNKLYLKH